MFDPETLNLAESVLAACRSRDWRVATAESCTGGLVAAALTAIAGASDVVERGFVTYSNEAKIELLGVPAETIAAHGAISAQTAAAMARGAVARAGVDLAVSVTGIAGPGGGTAQKPVGLVYLGVARKDGAARVERAFFPATAPKSARRRWSRRWNCSSRARRGGSPASLDSAGLARRVRFRRAVELPRAVSKAATMRRTASLNSSPMRLCSIRDWNSKSTKKSMRQPPGTRSKIQWLFR